MGQPRALKGLVVLGAWLLFSLEPLSGRLLIARFGGAFHVWVTALLFFQVALVLGYLYAHALAPRLGRWHLGVLCLAALTLPPSLPDGATDPSPAAVLRALALHLGPLAVLLSTTSVLAQRAAWRPGERAPYALYALSNAGSLAALLVDPLVLGPALGLSAQARLWTAGFGLYLLLAAGSLWRLPQEPPKSLPEQAFLYGYCTLLSALLSVLLAGVTSQLTLDVGHVPLLWTLPLALFLLAFVLSFAERPGLGAVERLWPYVALVDLYLALGGDLGSALAQGVGLLVAFFVVALALARELYRVRPEGDRLTGYYVTLAVGGALGGAFAALAAPWLFPGLWERPLATLAALMVVGWARRGAVRAWLRSAERGALIVTAALPAVIALRLYLGHRGAGPEPSARARSPYGVYQVLERTEGGVPLRELVSGTTRHGRQRPGSAEPLSYYHRSGPLGEVVARLQAPAGARRIAVIGLGVGASASYAARGDAVDFYELDPTVEALARAHFTFLRASEGRVTVVTGDARHTLGAVGPSRYDLVLVDAFAGDAIPTHLITREAIALEASRVAPGGALLFHASNRFHDLRPVLGAAARSLGMTALWKQHLQGLSPGEDPSRYVVVLGPGEDRAPWSAHGWAPCDASMAPWTDDHADPIALLVRQRLH
ncbi:MAG: fused MFS/spermidine synthase [Deltaproteobacteria bacterium]|nr:fused MFS/spermidine synthase [Deltaproteobacteria bacterium]